MEADEQQYDPRALYETKESFEDDLTPWPFFMGYCSHVQDYSLRNLTYAEDTLRAFAGIIRQLEPIYGELHYGVPEMFFDLALCWTPRMSVTRRVSTQRPFLNGGLPSWSWCGWQGRIDFDLSRDDYAYKFMSHRVKRKRAATVHEVCKWYKIGNGSDERSLIDVCYRKYRSRDASKEDLLEQGWSCHHKNRSTEYWTHVTIPNARFLHPIPLLNTDETLGRPLSSEAWSPYLYTATTRNWYTISTSPVRSSNGATRLAVFDSKSRIIGYVIPHSRRGKKQAFTRKKCEFIPLNLESIPSRRSSWSRSFLEKDRAWHVRRVTCA